MGDQRRARPHPAGAAVTAHWAERALAAAPVLSRHRGRYGLGAARQPHGSDGARNSGRRPDDPGRRSAKSSRPGRDRLSGGWAGHAGDCLGGSRAHAAGHDPRGLSRAHRHDGGADAGRRQCALAGLSDAQHQCGVPVSAGLRQGRPCRRMDGGQRRRRDDRSRQGAGRRACADLSAPVRHHSGDHAAALVRARRRRGGDRPGRPADRGPAAKSVRAHRATQAQPGEPDVRHRRHAAARDPQAVGQCDRAGRGRPGDGPARPVRRHQRRDGDAGDVRVRSLPIRCSPSRPPSRRPAPLPTTSSSSSAPWPRRPRPGRARACRPWRGSRRS